MRIKVNYINLTQNKKKDNLCIITDIHHIKSCKDNYYKQIINEVKSLHPQFILIPGDIVDSPKIAYQEQISYLLKFFSELSCIAPVIISKGNHELKKPQFPITKLYLSLKKIPNISVLDNQSIVLGKYQFIGFCPSVQNYLPKYKKMWNQNFIKEFNACNFTVVPNKIIILLCHSPEIIIENDVQKQIPIFNKINYIICGHMHNGLTPTFLETRLASRGIFGPRYTLFPKHCRGVHDVGSGQLVICKSLRVLTKDNIIFRSLDKFYERNITIIQI